MSAWVLVELKMTQITGIRVNTAKSTQHPVSAETVPWRLSP